MDTVTGPTSKSGSRPEGVGVWDEAERDTQEGSRPDGEMVGDGWALTPILGVGNETQWQSWPALGVFAKQKVLTQLKARFPPGRMEK